MNTYDKLCSFINENIYAIFRFNFLQPGYTYRLQNLINKKDTTNEIFDLESSVPEILHHNIKHMNIDDFVKNTVITHVSGNKFDCSLYGVKFSISIKYYAIIQSLPFYLHQISIYHEYMQYIKQRTQNANIILEDMYCAVGLEYDEKLVSKIIDIEIINQ